MENILILYPVIAMAALTFYVTIRLYFVQYSATKRREVKYGFFSVYRGEAPDFISAAREHYKNMFELPVLFYVWAAILYTSASVDQIDILLSWLFVLSRYIHSFIRSIYYSKILYRLSVFAIGFIIIMICWAKLLVQLVAG